MSPHARTRVPPDGLEATAVDPSGEDEGLAGIQRARLIAATLEVCAERGAGAAAISHIADRAGVSRRTFYELFTSREDCFLAAFDESAARAIARIVASVDPATPWVVRVRDAITALLSFFDSEPEAGRLLVVESLAAGPLAFERRQEVLARAVEGVDAGRREVEGKMPVSRLTAEAVIGGACAVVHTRMLGTDDGRLTGLVNPLTSMVVLPYRGPRVARAELERRAVVPDPPQRVGRADPLRGLDMRLTYRTVRVLAAVAANPEGSNRAIAEAAGIGDPGQASRLLTRLQRLGLVANDQIRSTKGLRNAWKLTPRGVEVTGVVLERSAVA